MIAGSIYDTEHAIKFKYCPNCGEKENFHFNYDYSKPNLPIEDVLCNECGTFFEYDENPEKYL